MGFRIKYSHFIHFSLGFGIKYLYNHQSFFPIILDLTVVLNFAIDGVWINFWDDFGERFREKYGS